MTVTNITGIPLYMHVRVDPPFYLLEGGERLTKFKYVELTDAQSETLVVEFDASVEQKSCSYVTGLMILDYQDHPHAVN